MKFRLISPTPSLAKYIKHYWFLEMEAGNAVGERVIPSGYVELTFHFADRLIKRKIIDEMQSGIVLSGQKTNYFDVVPTGKIAMLTVQFFPHSAGLFLDMPVCVLENLTLDAKEVFGRAAASLEEQLFELPSLELRIRLIEQFLLNRLAGKSEYDRDRMFRVIQMINQSNGVIGLEQLASKACLSRRQLDRVFQQWVGLSPKQFLRVVRFQYSLHVHQRYPADSLTALAYRCGYYDQSHMISDYKDLSGISPGQFFAQCEQAGSDYF